MQAELRTSHDTPKEAVAHFRAVRIECDQQPATGPTQFFAVRTQRSPFAIVQTIDQFIGRIHRYHLIISRSMR